MPHRNNWQFHSLSSPPLIFPSIGNAKMVFPLQMSLFRHSLFRVAFLELRCVFCSFCFTCRLFQQFLFCWLCGLCHESPPWSTVFCRYNSLIWDSPSQKCGLCSEYMAWKPHFSLHHGSIFLLTAQWPQWPCLFCNVFLCSFLVSSPGPFHPFLGLSHASWQISLSPCIDNAKGQVCTDWKTLQLEGITGASHFVQLRNTKYQIKWILNQEIEVGLPQDLELSRNSDYPHSDEVGSTCSWRRQIWIKWGWLCPLPWTD